MYFLNNFFYSLTEERKMDALKHQLSINKRKRVYLYTIKKIKGTEIRLVGLEFSIFFIRSNPCRLIF